MIKSRRRNLLVVASTICACLLIHCVKIAQGAEISGAEDLIVLKNERIEVGISRTDGTIRRLVNLEDTVDYCNQIAAVVWPEKDVPVGERIGGVIIHDELKNEIFSDLQTGSRISNLKVEEIGGRKVCTFEKRFDGADFLLRERMEMFGDHLRWEVKAVKLTGGDRSLKMVQFLPLPAWDYQGWSPIAEAPFSTNPWIPFQVNFGMIDGGSVGTNDWRTVIPMMVFYNNDKKNALCVVSPFEIPAIRIRYRNNIGVGQDFHWNSRNYSMEERPYLQVISEYLGLRDNRDAETGLLITVQPAEWRASLGWVYKEYREYFDPHPGFEPYDGAYLNNWPYPDSLSPEGFSKLLAEYYNLGIRWEEIHGHFTQYGQMIPPKSVKEWKNLSHRRRGYTNSRAKLKDHTTRSSKVGIGSFIYYNITESEWWYAKENYPDDISLDENGNVILAYRGASHPDSIACWHMCADPQDTKFGRDLAEQAREMLRAYPDIAGFFWDVFARTYRFDFAHDDGITMVNNKPAYFPVNMHLRMLQDVVGPLLHENGKFLTCNKPTMIQACKGIDAVMARERTPPVERPVWMVSQSYLGLNRQVMILDSPSWQHPERMFLNCLRYGFFYSIMRSKIRSRDNPEVVAQKEKAARLRDIYHPIIERFKGKKWELYPRALELPRRTDGNIFRLADGSVMITMVSLWRDLDNIPGTTPDLSLTCRLPDAAQFRNFTLIQPDLTGSSKGKSIEPAKREGDALTFKLDRHGLATVILLDKSL